MTAKEFDLLCIGNALVDIFATVRDSSLFDRLNLPASHIEIEKGLEILSLLQSEAAIEIVSGGGAANVAKIASLLKARVCFTGAVGRDSADGRLADNYGRVFEKELAAAGAELKLSLKTSATGICIYCRDGDETRIAASPSAALELSEADICPGDIRKAKMVLIDGFMLGRPGLVRKIIDLAQEAGTTAVIDLSSTAIAAEHAKEILDYAQRCPLFIFMNEAESSAFYREIKNEKSEAQNETELPQEALLFFQSLTADKGFPIIAVKLGSRGALCFSGGTMHCAETQALIPKESTGAGDAFCAGFLSAWIRKKSIAECAGFGNRAAGIVLDAAGTQVSVKHFAELALELAEELLKD